MSLILEALKKSEQQRRIGQVPNLGTPVIGTRRRRSLLPVLALLIVVALAIGAWMRFAPSPSGQPGSGTPTETTTGELAASDAANPPAAAASEPDKAPARANPQPARPLSAYQRERLRLTGELPKTDRKPRPPVSRPITQRAPPAKPAPPASAPPPATPPAKPATPAATPPAPTAPPAQAPAAKPAPAPVPYLWELPYATRKDLPPLQISMHVYADDPKQRFIVIDGESDAEGDELGEGLVVREIRADGVVLDVAGKPYLLPASGR
jgi:general secretion pathway protein B